MTDIEDKEIALAGEYVMGLLEAKEQQAVKDSLPSNPLLKHWVHYWEAQLPQLYTDIPSEQPSQHVWQQIKRKTQQDRAVIYHWQKTPWWQSLILWRGLTIASLFTLVGLATGFHPESLTFQDTLVTIAQKPIVVTSPNYIAVVRNNKTQALWHIGVYLAAEKLFVTALQPSHLPADKSYELWLLSEDNDIPPRSMGLMPTQGSQQLPLLLTQAMSQAQGLAISLEPLGGSPNAAPSGPIVFQTKLDHII